LGEAGLVGAAAFGVAGFGVTVTFVVAGMATLLGALPFTGAARGFEAGVPDGLSELADWPPSSDVLPRLVPPAVVRPEGAPRGSPSNVTVWAAPDPPSAPVPTGPWVAETSASVNTLGGSTVRLASGWAAGITGAVSTTGTGAISLPNEGAGPPTSLVLRPRLRSARRDFAAGNVAEAELEEAVGSC
jgi:hypothetical protein